VHAQNGQAKVKDNKIVVRRDWERDRDKIQGAFNIARDLAQKLAEQKKKTG
jgi:transcription-repair coupling factor (superfamily II helicase)